MADDPSARVTSIDPNDNAAVRYYFAMRASRATGGSITEVLLRTKANEAPIPGDELPEGWLDEPVRVARADLAAFRKFLRRPGGEAPREGDEIPKIRKPVKRAKSR